MGWLAIREWFFSVGEHSAIKGKATQPERILFNFETSDVIGESKRISKIAGVVVIKKPYEMGGAWIATFADPDGNYFQLMSPWKS